MAKRIYNSQPGYSVACCDCKHLIYYDGIKAGKGKIMFYQFYNIHLLNGDVLRTAEDYDLPASKGLIGTFERMKETDCLTVNDILLGSSYIPKRSILYITARDVKEVPHYGSKNKQRDS